MNGSFWVWFGCGMVSLILAPLMFGVTNKVKAFFGGRRGPSVFQLYYDLSKLFKKEGIYSKSACGLFPLAPSLSLSALLLASIFLPFGMTNSPFAFFGDALLFFYLLAFGRMSMVLGALETGSSFEGMGASREMQFSALTEAAVFAVLGFLALLTKSGELSLLLNSAARGPWAIHATSILLAAGAFFAVLLAENSRLPVDDPETHLELTMIHEVMILDYSGRDLGMLLYTASLKMWVFSSFLVMMVIPRPEGHVWGSVGLYFGGVFFVSVMVGAVESCMARYRLLKVPHMLVGALAVALLAMFFLLFFEGGRA